MMNCTHASNQANTLTQTQLDLPDRRQGKVRDIYAIPASGAYPPRIAIIATDRISAFDVVMPTPIPGKGRLLTTMAVKWFDFVRNQSIIGDHLISTDPTELPGINTDSQNALDGRLMIGRAAKVIPIECVARGYLAGSGWKEYQSTGTVCGIDLPENLQNCSQLPEPIFTPATKATEGHDENIDFDTACSMVGAETMRLLRRVTLDIYTRAADYASARGILIADTKFEFGWALDERGTPSDEIILIDEVLTPDSSRFWPAEDYAPGQPQRSFDKQYVREYLETLVEAGKWDKSPPGPVLPDEIVDNTLARYREALRRLFDC